MLRSEILDVAADELAAAAASIERERAAQAVLFLAAYEKKLRQIERFPRSGSIVQDSPGGIEFRVEDSKVQLLNRHDCDEEDSDRRRGDASKP